MSARSGERGWIFGGGGAHGPTRLALLTGCLRAFLGSGGGTLVFATATLVVGAAGLPAAPAEALLTLAVIAAAAIVAAVLEEFLHAVACVQQGGPAALRGVVTRTTTLTGVPLPTFLGVAYAPALPPRERACVAAAGPLGAAALLSVPAAILASATSSSWPLALVLLCAPGLVPFRRLTDRGPATDADAILDTKDRLGLGWRDVLGLCASATSRALCAPLMPDPAPTDAEPSL